MAAYADRVLPDRFQESLLLAFLAPVEYALATYSPLGRPAHTVVSVGEFSDYCTDVLVLIVEGSQLTRAGYVGDTVRFNGKDEATCADVVDVLAFSIELRRPGWPTIDQNGNVDRSAVIRAASKLLADGNVFMGALVTVAERLPEVLKAVGLEEDLVFLDLPVTLGVRRALVLDNSVARGWAIDVTIEVPLPCVDLDWLPLDEIPLVSDCPPEADMPALPAESSDVADWIN